MKTKLTELAEAWGYADPMDLIEDYVFDGVMPGICQNEGCDYSTEYEPDQEQGWCESCGTNTVMSASIMAGVI